MMNTTTKQCTGTTKAGSQCRQKPVLNTEFCALHTPGREVHRGKRSRHFGNIRKLRSGRWQATYWLDGKQHAQTWVSKADANAWLSKIQTDIGRGQHVDPGAGSDIFREYAEAWLTAGVKRGRIRPTTEAKYRGLLDRHLLDTFGDMQLLQIRKDKVQTWHDDLAAVHPSTAAGAYRLLATIFNSAIRDEVIPRSPCRVEGASRERAAERPTATVAECQAAVDATPERYRCAVLLAAWGQLRRGEVLALQRGDVDLTAGTVRVERAWVVPEGKQPILDRPKSDAGTRMLYLPLHVRESLEHHLTANVGPDRAAWLFPGHNGEPMHPRAFSSVWSRAREKAGRTDLHFHDLRHSGLTWVAQAGATTAELMRRGGHASPAAANRYQHAADERDKSLAEALGRMSVR
jgi:integrase